MAGATMPPEALNPDLAARPVAEKSGLFRRMAGALFG
jgi:hypothetical protein